MSASVTCRTRRVEVTRAEDDLRALAKKLARARDDKRPHLMALVSEAKSQRADADRLGNDTGRSDEAFLSWLMVQVPGGKKPTTRKWRVGEAGWRTR